MNKADYISLINSKLLDGTQLPSSQHRDTMHTDANSIIELVYGGTLEDDEATETYTLANSNFEYKIRLWKVGGNVHISGSFKALATISAGATIFEVTDTDLTSTTSGIFSFLASNSSDALPILMSDSMLNISSSIFIGESYNFTITYKSLN